MKYMAGNFYWQYLPFDAHGLWYGPNESIYAQAFDQPAAHDGTL